MWDIRNLFGNYYKPVRVNNFWNNYYIEYESKDGKIKTRSVEKKKKKKLKIIFNKKVWS